MRHTSISICNEKELLARIGRRLPERRISKSTPTKLSRRKWNASTASKISNRNTMTMSRTRKMFLMMILRSWRRPISKRMKLTFRKRKSWKEHQKVRRLKPNNNSSTRMTSQSKQKTSQRIKTSTKCSTTSERSSASSVKQSAKTRR